MEDAFDFGQQEGDSPQQIIGKMTASFMDFADKHELDEIVLGGIAIAGKTPDGTNVVLTRTTHRDPFACIHLWTSAAELEADMARRETVSKLVGARTRIEELTAQLESYGITPIEPE